jgi:dTMP kinase
MHKLIVIEGADASGKTTQCQILINKLQQQGHDIFTMSFPRYETPTGRIIGGPYLGKNKICRSYFDDAVAVDPMVASLYYTADRLNAKIEIIKNLNHGKIGIFNRYVESNLAHQGAKVERDQRLNLIQKLVQLDYEWAEMPKPSLVICLLMPYQLSVLLRKHRDDDSVDGHESDINHLRRAEETYEYLCQEFGFESIQCGTDVTKALLNLSDDDIMNLPNSEIFKFINADNIDCLIKSKQQIHDEVYNIVIKHLTGN